MDNLKYYNDSFAYDYEMFMPKEREKTTEIIDYPYKKESLKRKKANARANWLSENLFKIGASLTVFAIAIAYIYLNAEIDRVQSEINDVKAAIVEYESEQTRLEVEINRKYSYQNLEEAAAELGMQQPEKSQVMYIKTNTTDKAVDKDGNVLS